MNVSLKWIADHLDLAGRPADEVCDLLTFAGVEVEGVESHRGDTVLDLEVTPNRPDLLSHLGIARELAALTGLDLQGEPRHVGTTPTREGAEVTVADAAGCPFYTLRKISGVKVGASPAWLQEKLVSVGLRPINNVVDITNYVLLETGQPLHAFDAAKVAGAKIVVRPAAAGGEKFTALDGLEYGLTADDLVIADADRPVALAGVMGGEDSGVTAETTDVLLESAYFEPSRVRRTSRVHNLSSDSSYRFERGVDPAQVLGASDFATRLILELAGGEAAPDAVTAGSPPAGNPPVPLAVEQVRRLLGTDVGAAEIARVLSSLGLVETTEGWQPPSYRLDLVRPVDLIEEVARVIGLDAIPSRTTCTPALPSAADRIYDFALDLKKRLAATGFHEIQTIKLVSEAQLADAMPCGAPGSTSSAAQPMRLKNPLSDDHTALRPSLLAGLLATAERNVRLGRRSLRLFEIGTVFQSAAAPGGREESLRIGLLVSGAAREPSWATSDEPDRDLDAHDLIGSLDAVLGPVRLLPEPAETSSANSDGAFSLAAQVRCADKPVGRLVQLTPARARATGSSGPVVAAELDLEALAALSDSPKKFAGLPKFPAVTRDVALELPADLPNANLESFFASTGEPLLASATVFDVFTDPTGSKLPADRKSVAYTLTYRHPERTLTSDEVDAAHGAILESLKASLPAQIR